MGVRVVSFGILWALCTGALAAPADALAPLPEIEVPAGWRVVRDGSELRASDPQAPGELMAWLDVGEVPIQEEDLPARRARYVRTRTEHGAGEVRTVSMRVAAGASGEPVGEILLDVTERDATMRWVALSKAVPGGVAHIVRTGAVRDAARLLTEAYGHLDGLAVPKDPVARPTAGASLGGAVLAAPAGWRAPRGLELAWWSAAFGSGAELGMEDPSSSCWASVRPRSGAPLEAMRACAVDVALGIVDDDSFLDTVSWLRTAYFAERTVEGVDRLELSDRPAAVFRFAEAGMAAFVVPVEAGALVVEARLAPEADRLAFLVSFAEHLQVGPPHPVRWADRVWWTLRYRSDSPWIAAVGLLLLAVVVGAIGFLARPSHQAVDDLA